MPLRKLNEAVKALRRALVKSREIKKLSEQPDSKIMEILEKGTRAMEEATNPAIISNAKVNNDLVFLYNDYAIPTLQLQNDEGSLVLAAFEKYYKDLVDRYGEYYATLMVQFLNSPEYRDIMSKNGKYTIDDIRNQIKTYNREQLIIKDFKNLGYILGGSTALYRLGNPTVVPEHRRLAAHDLDFVLSISPRDDRELYEATYDDLSNLQTDANGVPFRLKHFAWDSTIPIDVFQKPSNYLQLSINQDVPWLDIAKQKAKWGRPKDLADIEGFIPFGKNFPVIDPVTGKSAYAPFRFGKNATAYGGFPNIGDVETYDDSGVFIPSIIDTDGRFHRVPLVPFKPTIRLGMQLYKWLTGNMSSNPLSTAASKILFAPNFYDQNNVTILEAQPEYTFNTSVENLNIKELKGFVPDHVLFAPGPLALGSFLEKLLKRDGTIKKATLLQLLNKPEISKLDREYLTNLINSMEGDIIDYNQLRLLASQTKPYEINNSSLAYANYGLTRAGFGTLPGQVRLFFVPGLRGNVRHYPAMSDGSTLSPVGHFRYTIDRNNPNLMYVTESLSDWAQQLFAKNPVDNELSDAYYQIHLALKAGNEPLQYYKDVIDQYERNLKDPVIAHMANTFRQRLLYEIMKYANEHGITILRFPGYDAAAKIEGYPTEEKLVPNPAYQTLSPKIDELRKKYSDEAINLKFNYLNEILDSKEASNFPLIKELRIALPEMKAKYINGEDIDFPLMDDFEAFIAKNYPDSEKLFGDKLDAIEDAVLSTRDLEIQKLTKDIPEYFTQTDYPDKYKKILKSYSDFPKMFKKMFGKYYPDGLIVKEVIGPNNNTWYEVHVPNIIWDTKKIPEYNLNFDGHTINIPSYISNASEVTLKKGGLIRIKKKNRGKFTASAKAHGMGVLEYANKVLHDPNATPLLKKRANFARNAKRFKH